MAQNMVESASSQTFRQSLHTLDTGIHSRVCKQEKLTKIF